MSALAFARAQLDRGMSEAAVRQALGLRQADWLAFKRDLMATAPAPGAPAEPAAATAEPAPAEMADQLGVPLRLPPPVYRRARFDDLVQARRLGKHFTAAMGDIEPRTLRASHARHFQCWFLRLAVPTLTSAQIGEIVGLGSAAVTYGIQYAHHRALWGGPGAEETRRWLQEMRRRTGGLP